MSWAFPGKTKKESLYIAVIQTTPGLLTRELKDQPTV